MWEILPILVLTLSCSNRNEVQIENLNFKTLDGKIYTWKDLKGKVIIVDFWASWCKPCRKSLPELDEIYKKYEGKVIVIGFSKDEDENAVKDFLRELPVSYPVAMSNRKIEDMFGGILGLPTSFLIDKNGKIVRRFLGYVPPDILEENIRRLL